MEAFLFYYLGKGFSILYFSGSIVLLKQALPSMCWKSWNEGSNEYGAADSNM